MMGRRSGLGATASAALILIITAGCSGPVDPSPSATARPSVTASGAPSTTAKPSTAASGSTTASASATASPTPSLPAGMPGGSVNYSVTDWGIPSGAPNELGSSLGQFPSATLDSVEIGKHPEGRPAFTRVSFRFKDAMPSCRLLYVREFRGTDDKAVLVEGNARLSAVFFTATGPAGATTTTGDGKPVVQGMIEVEDFEGYLGYGLGLQTAPQSDQARLVRCGHLQYTDTRPAPYVVFVDIQG